MWPYLCRTSLSCIKFSKCSPSEAASERFFSSEAIIHSEREDHPFSLVPPSSSFIHSLVPDSFCFESRIKFFLNLTSCLFILAKILSLSSEFVKKLVKNWIIRTLKQPESKIPNLPENKKIKWESQAHETELATKLELTMEISFTTTKYTLLGPKRYFFLDDCDLPRSCFYPI